MKIVSGIMSILLVVGMLSLASNIQSAKASTVTVPDDYSTIQEAINNASEGDTIFVRSGTYYENVTVNKAVSLVGENRATTIIHTTKTGRALIKLASGVNGVVIKGFTLEFPEEGWNNWAIVGAGVTNSVIEENIIADSTPGMGAQGLTHGIYLVYYSANNTIRRNVISNVSDTSIYFDNSGGGNEVYENTIEGSGWYGVQIQGSCQKGPDKFYHNNFSNNYHQVHIYDPLNVVRDVWDDGYPSGGNYWSYAGVDRKSGPNQDIPGGDGIGDRPINVVRTINADNQDHYPLTKPYTTPLGIRDVAVLNVTPCTRQIWTGWSANINVTVNNRGDNTDNRTVTVYYGSHLIETRTVTLAPSENITLRFTWDTTNAVPGTYIIKALVNMVLAEANTTDNGLVDGTVRIRIVGDVNGDNKTDIRDMASAALAFGSYSYTIVSPRWNPDADINGDGRIDIRDLVLIAKNYGKKYP